MRKVYVTNYAGHDYTQLEKFGKIVPITTGYVSFDSLDRIKVQVAQGIIDSDREDYLALSGAAIIGALASLLWFCKHRKVKLLNYDRVSKDYREVVITDSNANTLMNILGSNRATSS